MSAHRYRPDWDELRTTADWIAGHQRDDGAIPWFHDRRMDPWDHVQSAMALTVAERLPEAQAAYRFLAATQDEGGAWAASTNTSAVIDATRESNHAAYLATGLWHYYRSTHNRAFLIEMWPTLERAIEFVLSLQHDDGTIHWATDSEGNVWPAPLLAGCSSIYGSLACALRVAERIGERRDHWRAARQRLAHAMSCGDDRFRVAAVPEPPGRYAMDWYYPVLGGVMRGDSARRRLIDGHGEFIDEGAGCRCVRDRAWFTVAETCELVIALEISGLQEQAHALFEWVGTLRCEDGGYWMGITQPNGLRWPPQRPSWTAATVILAADTLDGLSPTSSFFADLGRDGGVSV